METDAELMAPSKGAEIRSPVTARVSNRSLLTHPAFIVGLAATLVSEWLLPLQYRPVLFRHDLEMLAFSCSILAGGIAYASYRRARAARAFAMARVVEAAAAALVAFGLGALWMRFVPHGGVTGIGAPRPWVVALVVVWAGVCATGGAVLGAHMNVVALRSALAGVLVLTAVLGLAVASAQLNSQPSGIAIDACVTQKAVRYCHYRGYRPFVDDWAKPVEAVLREMPRSVVASRPLLVRQGSATWGAHHLDLDAIATPMLQWSPASTARLSLALDTASSFVGVNDDYKPGERNGRPVPNRTDFGCAPGGDSGRMVVAWWLAGQVDKETRRQVIHMSVHDRAQDAVTGSGYAQVVGGGPTPLAAQLLARDDAQVGAAIRAHWEDLTAPNVGVAPIMQLFGLKPSEGVGPSREVEDPREIPRGCPPAPRR